MRDLIAILIFNLSQLLCSKIRVNNIEADNSSIFNGLFYDLQASALKDVNEARKIAFKRPLKIQRMLSVSLVKIDGSSMSLTRI